jgi:hypothetical protein
MCVFLCLHTPQKKAHVRIQEEDSHLQTRQRTLTKKLISQNRIEDLQPPQLWENKCLWLSQPVYNICYGSLSWEIEAAWSGIWSRRIIGAISLFPTPIHTNCLTRNIFFSVTKI